MAGQVILPDPNAPGVGVPQVAEDQPTHSGAWRLDSNFNGRDGLKIVLKAEQGVTPKGFLEVPFRFQAPPVDTFGRRYEFDFQTFQTVRLGERPRAGGPNLERPTFQTMLLDEELRWLVWTGSFDVQRMVEELREILRKPCPFRLVIAQPELWGPRPLVSIPAVFTSLEFEQRHGEVGTEYSSVEFMEWPTEQLERKRRKSSKDQERRHELHRNDTLYVIARRYYGKSSLWRTIAKANGIPGVQQVPPDSAPKLAAWAKAHNRHTLKIPPKPKPKKK